MSIIDDILAYNRVFIENKEYEKFQTTKFPDKRLVVLSCMDTRLEELLPKAMNLRNGDFKHVKSAGAVVSHPFGSIMRSILVAIYELNAEEVVIVGHYDCGMSVINADRMMAKMKEKGISEETFSIIKNSGLRLHSWLRGFDCVEDSVKQSVEIIKNHPLLPKQVPVHGLLIDPTTGRLDRVVDGYELANPAK
ncbi:beta-class carbonic anhydrase [Brevibacillus borstelensis]|uniref:beta-class carbonic anhydrase n=1 Tax=Brevibacillus borstelensis TaxID=45462 RepID=UPI0030BA9043